MREKSMKDKTIKVCKGKFQFIILPMTSDCCSKTVFHYEKEEKKLHAKFTD